MSDNRANQEALFTEAGKANRIQRYRHGLLWHIVFFCSMIVSVLFLATLLATIINRTFGNVAVGYEVHPDELITDGLPLGEQTKDDLIRHLENNLRPGLIRRYNVERPLEERTRKELLELVIERIVNPHIIKSWTLFQTLFFKKRIMHFIQENPESWLQFRSWVNPKFLSKPQASVPELAGIRTAILGSLWIIAITIVVAFPIGVAAAVYLEEYTRDSWYNRFIQVNIYNLSGVPSIIYGLLGLAIFVRSLEPLTSGAMLGAIDPTTANGRTILSAGLTLALLILPIIIINSQEAIKAVPKSLRDSSYGLGATKWQTIWYHVLPAAMERILTGAILAISRALGETAPLVVVGASTFIAIDPDSLFSKFTALPIQIYQWTARPQAEFRNAAAAAILVLLVLLLSMNTGAIILRNRIGMKRRTG
ncbi:MAG: phosphate ABC transporter permease PstA [Spirochaetota bacterium]